MGGATSHAAVVARGNNLPCVVGCEDITVDLDKNQFTLGNVVVKENDTLSIDGTTGEVFVGASPTVEIDLAKELELATLLSWADEIRTRGRLLQRRLSPGCCQGSSVRRPRYRPLPHRAHVL